jgi:exodeoxyribonuclease V gamma subunit
VTPRAVDIDLDLGSGRRLVGTVTDVHDRRVVRAGYSRLGAKHELDAWLAVLALECAHPGRGWSAGAVGRGRSGQPPLRVAFSAPEDAMARMADLVALYDDGMTGPLPMPLRTAHAFARRRASGGDDWQCAKAAKDAWDPYRSRFPGENDDAAHRFVWGARSPVEVLQGTPLPGEEQEREPTRLGALAVRLWRPILKAAHR